MTDNEQAANQTVSPAKLDWIKPEITSFTAAVDAQGNQASVTTDPGFTTNFS